MSQYQQTKDIISIRQIAMVYMMLAFSLAVRLLPSYTAKYGKEAGWISPLAAIPPILIAIYLLHRIYSKSEDKSTVDVIRSILGRPLGNAVLLLHLIWVLFLIGFYTRYNAERLVSSVYPNVNITFFLAITLIVVSYALRSGITAIGRMGELLTPIILLLFTFLTVFLLPKIRLDALLPVYFNDAVPVIKASRGTLTIYSYGTVMLLLSDKIVGKKNIMKTFTTAGAIFLIIEIALLISVNGVIGPSVSERSPIAFLTAVKQISVLDTIENIESIVVAMWLLSDALLITTMTAAALNISKNLFKLADSRNLINILFVFIYLSSLGLASNRLELDLFAATLLTHFNIILGYGTPILLFIVGKLRKKIA